MSRNSRGARATGGLAALAVLAGLLAVTAGGCATGENNWTGGARGPERSQKLTETVPVEKFKGLSLRTGPGEVSVTGWDGAEVAFEVDKRAAGADAAAVDAYLETVQLDVKVTGETVQVSTVAPQPPAGVKLVGVYYVVRVPKTAPGSFAFETDRATVRLAGLAGTAKAKVRQADLDVRDFLGDLTAQIENGQALVSRLEGQLDLRSNGPVEVYDSRLHTRARVETVNSRIDFTLAELGVGEYELATSNAPIRIGVPFGAAAHFRVATTNGRVYDELPLTWVDRNETDSDGVYHFEGWLNAGGAQVGVATTNADVTLAYR